jgi:tetratricopeptide (TPR) repeat protein
MTAMKESKILTLFSRPLVTVPLLLFLVVLSYANTLYSPFVFDDMHSFVDEPYAYVRDFSYDSFSKLSNTFFGKARLIPMITFSINHYMAKGQMPIYHITNIAIHLLATFFVYWFITTLLRTRVGVSTLRGFSAVWFSLFAAALWALNPVQTNAVTYIVQRMTSLSALFYLATLTFYVKGRLAATRKNRGFFYVFSAGMAGCAFLSKENSFMLPAAILLVEWIFISPGIFVKIFQRMKWYHWLAIFLVAIALLPLAEQRWTGILNTGNFRPFTWDERLLTQSRVVVYYMTLLLLPLPGRMNLDYDFPISTSIISPPTTLVAIILLGLVLIWSFYRREKYPLIVFGVFWYFLNLVIESTVIPLELVFEHRLYLPSVGFYIACLAGLDLLLASLKTKYAAREVEQVFVLLMVILVTFFSIGTTVRNNVWRDSYALYSDSVKKSPNKPRPHLDLGVAMGRDVDLERESIAVFERVIELGKPKKERYLQAATNIVVTYANLGEFEEAIARGEKYIEEAPDYVKGDGYTKLMNNLAYAYGKTGQYSEAMQALASAMTLERKRLNTYLVNAMVITLTAAYDHEEYRDKLELTEEDGNKALSVQLRMARLLSDLREYEKADVFFLKEVLEDEPEHDLARELNETIQEKLRKNRKQEELMNLENHPPYTANMTYRISFDLSDFIFKHYSPLYFAVGSLLDKAEKASQPDDPFVLWYRIKWYMKTGDREKLVQELEKAARLQPDFVPLLRLTGEYYERIGDWDKAVEIYSHILELYPGEPAWLQYKKKIAAYNENKTTQ